MTESATHPSHERAERPELVTTLQVERIVAAAVTHSSGLVFSLPRPARHHHVLRAIFDTTGDKLAPFDNWPQGFLTSEGRFVGREEARRIVVANGQKPRPDHSWELFSEDLW